LKFLGLLDLENFNLLDQARNRTGRGRGNICFPVVEAVSEYNERTLKPQGAKAQFRLQRNEQ